MQQTNPSSGYTCFRTVPVIQKHHQKLTWMLEFSITMLPRSNRGSSPNSIGNMSWKKPCAYEQRLLEVEHATFTPLVFPLLGGWLGRQLHFTNGLPPCSLRSGTMHPYSATLCWVRSRLAFSLLRSSIQCIRGARSSIGHAVKSSAPVDLVNAEAQLRLL